MDVTLVRSNMNNNTLYPAPKFSEKDVSVLQWLADGKQISDIAELMKTQETSIRSRVSRIKDKLGANTLAGAVTLALRGKLIK